MMNSSTLSKNLPLTCWVITEGMIGTENQCVGVAEMLELTPDIKKITLREPWKTFTPWLGFEIPHTFTPPLYAPWPDILITSGRKSVAVSRYIKKKSNGKTFTVHIQDPKINPNQFDLLAVPFHDSIRGKNVIITNGAPNRLTKEKLEQEKKKFAPLFKPMNHPRVAVLIGGNSRTHKLTSTITNEMVKQLATLDSCLMVTTSRRTGDNNLKTIQDGLSNANNYIWDGTGENPYFAMLAWADYIIVTSDSTSMISDAGTTGKPVYIVSLEGSSSKFDRLHNHFQEIGVTRPFTGNLEPWHYEPLNDAAMVAKAIKEAWDKP